MARWRMCPSSPRLSVTRALPRTRNAALSGDIAPSAALESRALRGAVAQLGERRVRNAKVEGSIPFRSTRILYVESVSNLQDHRRVRGSTDYVFSPDLVRP